MPNMSSKTERSPDYLGGEITKETTFFSVSVVFSRFDLLLYDLLRSDYLQSGMLARTSSSLHISRTITILR